MVKKKRGREKENKKHRKNTLPQMMTNAAQIQYLIFRIQINNFFFACSCVLI